jgi:vancomycin resistance protein VanJ
LFLASAAGLRQTGAVLAMTETKPNLVDRGMDALAEALKRRHQPGGLWSKFRRFVGALNGLYAVFLLLLLLFMRAVGERHWLSAFCLFVPGQVWLLPLGLLTPLTLLFVRRWMWVQLGCVLLVAFGFYQWEWSWRPTPKQPVMVVMSNNYGQNGRHSFTAFQEWASPDVIALQECPGQAGRLARGFTNYQARAISQFILLSRIPILNAGVVPVYDQNGQPVAAWFELSFQSRTVVVYNVHMPTPRRELYQTRGLGLFAALAGVGQEHTRLGKYREGLENNWSNRIDLAERLVTQLRKENRPMIVAGDFNMNSHGYVYRVVSADLRDAFAERGRGYGLTFPGYTRNPLTLFGPWLRIDYLFAGRGFRPVFYQAEEDRKSQHRAIMARFEVQD